MISIRSRGCGQPHPNTYSGVRLGLYASMYISTYYINRLNLDSTVILFFKLSAKRYGLGLSNELLFIVLAEEAVKL